MDRLRTFRTIAVLEGLSYVLLLGVAMPLKYVWGMPMAVKIVGWAHGMLFIAYLVSGHLTASRLAWKPKFRAWALMASLIPLAAFVLERQMAQMTEPD